MSEKRTLEESESTRLEGLYRKASDPVLRTRLLMVWRMSVWEKSLPEQLKEIRKAYPKAEIELWAEDEARLGLKPVMRRVWAPVGKRPKALFKRGYKWSYLYGFVRPESGEGHWLILPTVNVELFSMALNEFAEEVGAGE